MCGSEVQNKALKQNILILPLSESTDKRNHVNTKPFVFTSKVEKQTSSPYSQVPHKDQKLFPDTFTYYPSTDKHITVTHSVYDNQNYSACSQ